METVTSFQRTDLLIVQAQNRLTSMIRFNIHEAVLTQDNISTKDGFYNYVLLEPKVELDQLPTEVNIRFTYI